MALFGRKKTTVGLDIGSGLIKVAVVDHSKKEPELTRVAIQPLQQDAIVEGEVMDPGVVAEAIQSALSSAECPRRGRHRRVVSRRDHQEDPDRAREGSGRRGAHGRWAAEQHVPFDMESVELDFQILAPTLMGRDERLARRAKRELVDSKVRVLTDAGLEPVIVAWTPSRCTKRVSSSTIQTNAEWSDGQHGHDVPTSTSSRKAFRF